MTVASRRFEAGSPEEMIARAVRRQNGAPINEEGESNPTCLYIIERDGTVRPANRAERRLATRTYSALRRAGA